MFIRILKVSHPGTLFIAAMTYSLGAVVAQYLGSSIQVVIFGLGLLSVMTLLAAAFLFTEYFHIGFMPLLHDETPRQKEQFQVTLLQVSYAAITLSFTAILGLALTHSINPAAGVLFISAVVLLVIYAIPPVRLTGTGYGELILAFTLGTLIPTLAFLLQQNQYHRLLFFTTFPLTLLAIAYEIACNFPSFARDKKIGHNTLLTRLGWQAAVPIHHFLILATFLFFAVAPLLGYPWSLVWPVFLAFPFAVMQIIRLQVVANGGRVMWNLLIALASATFGLTVYLLALTFWMR